MPGENKEISDGIYSRQKTVSSHTKAGVLSRLDPTAKSAPNPNPVYVLANEYLRPAVIFEVKKTRM